MIEFKEIIVENENGESQAQVTPQPRGGVCGIKCTYGSTCGVWCKDTTGSWCGTGC